MAAGPGWGCGSPHGEPVTQISATATALQAVLTPHNDNGRAGATRAETALTTSAVNPTHFGPLTGLPVRGGGGRGPRDHPA